MVLPESEDALSGAGEAGPPPSRTGEESAATRVESPPPEGDLLLEIEAPTDNDVDGLAATQAESPPPEADLFAETEAPTDSDADGLAATQAESPPPDGDLLLELEAPTDSDAEGLAATQAESPPPDADLLLEIDAPTDNDAERLAATQAESPPPDAELFAEIEAPTDNYAEGRPPEHGAYALETDEPLDPALEQLFLEANAEAEQSVPVSELPNIPIQELLNELLILRRSLGIERSTHAESTDGAEAAAQTESASTLEDRPTTLEDLPTTLEDRPVTVDTRWPTPTFSRTHALNGLLLSLTLVMAVASVLIGADHVISDGQNQNPRPPAIASVTPGVAVRQVPNQPDVEPAQAPPTATATPPSAYFLYTVQEGDTLTGIAAAFGLSLDHILWTNPEVIDDPDLLFVGDRLLIPNVAGVIYYVEPGDILRAVGHLLPNAVRDESDTRSGRPGPP